MNYGEIFHPQNIRQTLQPFAVILGELVASPLYRLGGLWIKAVKRTIGRAVVIVIAFDARRIHGAHDIEAGFGISAIPHKVAKKRVMSAPLFLRILENCLKGFEIRVDIGHDGEFHGSLVLNENNVQTFRGGEIALRPVTGQEGLTFQFQGGGNVQDVESAATDALGIFLG
jgi:hypothetical protein